MNGCFENAPVIVIYSNQDEKHQFVLSEQGKNYTLGRDEDCHFQVSDTSISGKHLELIWTWTGRVQIKDLKSLNGVEINSVKRNDISEIFPEDAVRIGNLYLRLLSEKAPLEDTNHTTNINSIPSNDSQQVFLILIISLLLLGSAGLLTLFLYTQ